jgi:hypothetical protein
MTDETKLLSMVGNSPEGQASLLKQIADAEEKKRRSNT